MALSGEDGHVLWQTPVATRAGDDVQQRSARVTYAADGVAVVVVAGPLSTEPGYGDTSTRHTDDPLLVAIDTADGTVLWQREGLGAAGVAGDTVFAYPGDETDSPHARRPARSVVALDTATGELHWDVSDRYSESSFVLAAGDLALVKVPNREPDSAAAPGLYETLVVEAATGREVVSFGTTASVCAAGDELIACAVSGPHYSEDRRLATLRVDDREASVSEAALPRGPMSQGFFQAIVDGRIFIGDDHRPASTLDRFANTIDADLPGDYLAMSDRYGIFEPVDDATSSDGAYTVHRIDGTG